MLWSPMQTQHQWWNTMVEVGFPAVCIMGNSVQLYRFLSSLELEKDWHCSYICLLNLIQGQRHKTCLPTSRDRQFSRNSHSVFIVNWNKTEHRIFTFLVCVLIKHKQNGLSYVFHLVLIKNITCFLCTKLVLQSAATCFVLSTET